MTTQHAAAGVRPAGRPRFEGRVDADAVYAFARATNDGNERYERGEAVPPLFTATLILDALWHSQREGGFDESRIVGRTGGAHGEHDIHFRGPVRPGMALQWEASTYGAHQTAAGVVVTQRIVLADEHGTELVEHLWSSIHIGGRLDEEVGPPLPEHAFPAASRSRLVTSRSLAVDRDQAFRYAGVSGDHAEHALTDDTARREGHPGKILQGMCTFAMISGQIVDAVAGGDPERLRRLAVRFAAPTFPGKEIVIGVYDAGRTSDGSHSFAFEASQGGTVVMKHGRVDVAA